MAIRVGVIGAGNIGTTHARNLATAVSGSQANAEISAPPSVLSGFMPYSVRSARHCASVLPLFKCMGMIRVVAIFPPWKKTQEGACAFSHSAYSVYP